MFNSIKMSLRDSVEIPTSFASSVRVRMHQILDFLNVTVVSWDRKFSLLRIIFNWFTTTFESGKPFLTLRTASLQWAYFKSFHENFSQFHPNFTLHRCSRKSYTAIITTNTETPCTKITITWELNDLSTMWKYLVIWKIWCTQCCQLNVSKMLLCHIIQNIRLFSEETSYIWAAP